MCLFPGSGVLSVFLFVLPVAFWFVLSFSVLQYLVKFLLESPDFFLPAVLSPAFHFGLGFLDIDYVITACLLFFNLPASVFFVRALF